MMYVVANKGEDSVTKGEDGGDGKDSQRRSIISSIRSVNATHTYIHIYITTCTVTNSVCLQTKPLRHSQLPASRPELHCPRTGRYSDRGCR